MRLLGITLGLCCITLVTLAVLLRDDQQTFLTTDTPPVPTNPLTAVTPTSPPKIQPVSERITTPAPRTIAFGVPVTFTVGETYTFSDELSVTLDAIHDSRCAPDVQCIWAGERAPQFTVVDIKTMVSEVINLDASRNTSLTTDSYTYTLVNTTEPEATIIISPTTTETSETTTSSPKIALKTPPVATQMAQTNTTAQPPVTTDIFPTEFKTALVREIEKQTNAFRRANKRPPLMNDNALARNATQYSSHLHSNQYLSHTDLQGCDITCRFNQYNYTAQAWGENLAMLTFEEQPSVEYVANFFMKEWKKSAGHRENLLSPQFTNQGIGLTLDQNSLYMVVHFANPR